MDSKKLTVVIIAVIMVVTVCAGMLVLIGQNGAQPQASQEATTPNTEPTATPTPSNGVATNVKSVTASAGDAFGVFTSGEKCKISFVAPVVPDGKVEIFYTITNYSTKEQQSSSVILEAGQRKVSVEYELASGVYEFTYRPETTRTEGRMFLTSLIDKEATGGDAFGMDFASFWHTNVGDRIRYMEMLKLAGIVNVRERINISETTKGDLSAYLGEYQSKIDTLKKNGFDVILTWHDIPDGMKNTKNGDDLMAVYAHLKGLVSQAGDKVTAWEIWNEQDVIHFSDMYPDQYSAYLKACAIAISDGNPNTIKALGAFARTPDYSKFGDWMMKNGVMDYVDVYNFHTYSFTNYGIDLKLTVEDMKAHLEYAKQYGGSIPAWQTECGTVHDGDAEKKGNDSMVQQSKYWVITAVEAAAMGVERNYPFLLVPYGGSDSLSFFSVDGYALPGFGAYATAIKMLGECNINGKYDRDGVLGYRVDNNGEQVAILYSLSGKKTLNVAADSAITVTDMYGCVREVQPENGVVTLEITSAPIYLTTLPDGFESFTPEKDEIVVKSLSEAQRVVLLPVFNNNNSPDMPTKETLTTGYEGVNSGYRFDKGETAEVSIKVFNYNGDALSGKVSVKLPEGWTAEADSFNVEVGAMNVATVTFKLTAAQDITAETLDEISFEADFGIGDISPCVSLVSGR